MAAHQPSPLLGSSQSVSSNQSSYEEDCTLNLTYPTNRLFTPEGPEPDGLHDPRCSYEIQQLSLQWNILRFGQTRIMFFSTAAQIDLDYFRSEPTTNGVDKRVHGSGSKPGDCVEARVVPYIQ